MTTEAPTPAEIEQALEVLEAATHAQPTDTPIAQAVDAHLAASATPPKPKYLDLGPQYLGPVAINGT